MISHMQKGLKLSPGLCQSNPPPLQIHQALHRRIFRHQQLERVIVQNCDSSGRRTGQNVGLCCGQLCPSFIEHSQVFDRAASLEKSNADLWIVALHHRLQRVTQNVALSTRCPGSQRKMLRL